MTACETTEPLLQAYLDGELEIEETHDVETHLGECATCQEARDDLGVLGDRLRSMYQATEAQDVPVELPGVEAPEVTAAAGVADTGAVSAAVAAWQNKGNKPSTPAVAPVRTPSGMGVISGRIGGYEIKGEIARGGMGCVYRAVQISMDRPVALKVLKSDLCQNEKYVARFLREARVAATISHPNLVSIYDVGQDDGRLYYSMELVEGEDGEQILDRQGHLAPREAVRIAAGVARALVAASQASVVHRDIKPANILVTAEGGIKVADLGLAKDVDDQDSTLTRSKTIIGSPNYMSPEQAEDLRRADMRSDVYMLGATLLHFLSGEVPFGPGSPIEILSRVLRDPLTLPEVLPGGEAFDPALKAIVARCMEKKPEDRYPSAKDLLGELEGYLAGAKSSAKASGMGARASGRGSVRKKQSRRVGRSGRARRAASSEGKVRAFSDSGSGRATSRVTRKQGIPPIYFAAAAAAFFLAVGVVFVTRGSRAPVDADTESSERAEAPTPAPSAEPESTPRLVSDRQDPEPTDPKPKAVEEAPAEEASSGEEPSASDVEVQLAALLQWRDENPDRLGELYRRATSFAEAYPEGASGEQARLLAETSETRLRELIRESEQEANRYEAEGRLVEAEQVYTDFVTDHGKDVPGGPQAVLAQRALGNQIKVKLQGHREKIEALLAAGDAAGAEELFATVGGYAGESAATRLRAEFDDALSALAKAPQEDEPKAEEPAALLARATPLFDRVREALSAGNVEQAERLLGRARERFGEAEALKEHYDELTAALEVAKKQQEGPGLEALLAALFQGEVELRGDGRVSLSYAFKSEGELEDWHLQTAPKDWGQNRLYEFLLKQPMRRKPSGDPWQVQRGLLVGYGYTRFEFGASFSPEAPLTVDVEAKGKQNLLVGFRGNRTVIGGLGYLMETLPLAKLAGRGAGGGVKKYLDTIDRGIDATRKRGPSLAVFSEQGLLNHEEHFAVPVKLKSKSAFGLELADKTVSLRVKKVEESTQLERKLGGQELRVLLIPLGAVVGYDRITISGKLSESFMNRARRAAREVGNDLSKVRARFHEIEAERLERERERARDRGKDRDKDDDDEDD